MLSQINIQSIPPFESLLASMPSGREIHSSPTYVAQELETDVLERLRAPPDAENARALAKDDDSSEDEAQVDGLPGTFPSGVASGSAGNEYY